MVLDPHQLYYYIEISISSLKEMECDITLMTCYMSLCNILSSLSTSGPHTSRSCLCPEQLTPGVCLLKVCFFILWEQTWHLVHTLLYRLVTRPIGLSTEHLDLLLMALSFLLKLSPQKVDSGPTDRQFRQVNGGELAQPVKRHDTGPQICEYWYFTIRVITRPAYCKGVTYTDHNLCSPWKQSIVTERC